MKKIILSLLSTLLIAVPSFAATTWSAVDRVPIVGKQILTKNNLPTTTKFVVTETAVTNSSTNTNNEFYIQKTDLGYTGNDNEVAAVISQELGALINANASKKKFVSNIASALAGGLESESAQNKAILINQISISSMSEKDQMNADITGIDLMIQAGYNPLAMIVVLGKKPGTTWETMTGQLNNLKRTQYIYDYLTYNYPSKVSAGYNCQEYKNFWHILNQQFPQETLTKEL